MNSSLTKVVYTLVLAISILPVMAQKGFMPGEPFQILSSAKSMTKQSTGKDTNQCRSWTLSRPQLVQVIKDSRQIGGTEWDLSFLVLPCIIKGQLKQQDRLFDFEVNGGSWMYIHSSDTTLILGNFRKSDEKYFLERPSKE